MTGAMPGTEGDGRRDGRLRGAWIAGVLAVLLAGAACVPDEPERSRDAGAAAAREGEGAAASAEGATSASDVPDVEEIPFQVFRTDDADFAPGRETLHALVPFDASQEQIRQTLVGELQERSRADTSLVALRAVAYKPRRVEGKENEATLVPVGWGEWLPPGGWVTEDPGARERTHRIYTYFGTPPEW